MRGLKEVTYKGRKYFVKIIEVEDYFVDYTEVRIYEKRSRFFRKKIHTLRIVDGGTDYIDLVRSAFADFDYRIKERLLAEMADQAASLSRGAALVQYKKWDGVIE